MSTEPDAQLVAMLDQADAAAADGARLAATLATLADHATVAGIAPVELRTLGGLAGRAAAGTLGRCAHLGVGPVSAVWLAWAPGRLLCVACAATVAQRVAGTDEDNRCDACGRVAPPLVVTGRHLPALVVDAGPGRRYGIGPITALVGYCRRCAPDAARPGRSEGRRATNGRGSG